MLQAIRAFFRNRARDRRTYFSTADLRFRPLVPGDIAQELGLEEKGTRAGRANQPATDATRLDGAEGEAVAHIDWLGGQTLADARAAYTGLTNRIEQARSTSPRLELGSIVAGHSHDLDVIIHEGLPSALQAAERRAESEREYESFRAANGITRQSRRPRHYLPLWAMLVFSIVGETLANSVFFQKGSATGLSGGAVAASLLAFVDVVIAFRVARAIPWYVARRPLFAALSVGAGIFLAAWAVIYNLAVAHMREALQLADWQAAGVQARSTLLATPLGLTQVDSWALFAIGIVFSISAILAGMKWDDPFPGYGAVSAEREVAWHEYDFRLDAIRSDGKRVHERAVTALDDLRSRGRTNVRAWQQALETKRSLARNSSIFIERLPVSCETLLQIYRDANRLSRSTPPPPYFDRPLEHPWPKPIGDEGEVGRELVAAASAEWAETEPRLGEALSELERDYAAFLIRVDDLHSPLDLPAEARSP